MIRPFTFITMLLAGGSGLYLYSTKHQAQVMDREIARIVKAADTAKERTDVLRAEWALLNEPDRLAELAHAHLNLKTLAPTQFVALNDLAARLPPPAPPGSLTPPPGTTDAEEPPPAPPVAQAAPPPRPAPVAVAQAAPPPPKPAAPPRPVPVAAAPAPAPAAPAPAAVAEVRPVRHIVPHLAEPPVQVAAAPPHPSPRPFAPVVAVSASSGQVGNAAVAPGTIGESVLRAMRSNASYTAPAYAQPVSAPPTYASPPPSYAAAPSGSLLGGMRSALPPPVPFAAR